MWMSAAPPADYVAFVERWLPLLRDRVAGELPAAGRAEVTGEVLSDLAGRWVPLRVAGRLRPGLIEQYADRAADRRMRQWRERQIYPVDVWSGSEPVPAGPPRAWRVSVALRRAAVLDSTVRPGYATLADAAIAWWHAYAARRRAVRVARLVLVVLLLLACVTARG